MEAKERKRIDATLQDFGLSPEELKVYKTVLNCGSRPATIIAEKSNLKRGQTYNILNNLIELGVVQELFRNGVRWFTSTSPSNLLSVLENREIELSRKRRDLEEILPLLNGMRSSNSSDSRVRFYTGVRGIKEVQESMLLESDSEIHSLIDARTSPIFNDGENFRWINNYIAKRAERNIWWRGIANKSPESDFAITARASCKREVKMIENIDLPVAIHVYGGKVAVTSTLTEQIGIVVENESLADTMRNISTALWNFLPDYIPDLASNTSHH